MLSNPLPIERPSSSHMGDGDDIAKAVTMSLKVCVCLVFLRHLPLWIYFLNISECSQGRKKFCATKEGLTPQPRKQERLKRLLLKDLNVPKP